MARNTSAYMDQLTDQLNNNSKNYLQKLESSEHKLEANFDRLSKNVLNEFNYSKLYVEERLGKIESKLDSLIQQSFRHTNSNLDSMNSSIVDQLRSLQRRIGEFEERVNRGVVEAGRSVSGQLSSLKSESIDNIRAQVNAFRDEMRMVMQDLGQLKRALGVSEPAAASSRKY